jgi:hypothetical protein
MPPWQFRAVVFSLLFRRSFAIGKHQLQIAQFQLNTQAFKKSDAIVHHASLNYNNLPSHLLILYIFDASTLFKISRDAPHYPACLLDFFASLFMGNNKLH